MPKTIQEVNKCLSVRTYLFEKKRQTDIEFRSYFPFRCNLLLKHSENIDRKATHQGAWLTDII